MKKSFFLILFVLACYFIQAQQTAKRDMSKADFDPIGIISGKVVDADSNQPVEYATISLYRIKDQTLVTGTVTNNKGEFTIDKVPFGRFRMDIKFIGYKSMSFDSIFVRPQSKDVAMGSILLQQQSTSLEQVNVSAEKPIMQSTIEKKIFNVEKNITSQGGSAVDVLANIPSVAVDIDGKVSFRGSENVSILIDGKPSSIVNTNGFLEQIPSNSIESIEIIANPSAKYDPDGMSGIINIVLKKNRKGGMNGSFSIGAGTLGQYTGSINYNYRTGPVNFFVNYGYNNNRMKFTGQTKRTNNYLDSTSYFDQYSFNKGNPQSHLLKTGFDYAINSKNSVSLSLTLNSSKRDMNGEVQSKNFNLSHSLSDLSYRFSDDNSSGNSYDFTLNWRKTFDKPGQTLNTDVYYSTDSDDDQSDYRDQVYNLNDTPNNISPILQQTNALEKDGVFTFQTEYVHPFTESIKLETGYKAMIRSTDNDLSSESFDYQKSTWVNDVNITNHFVYKEQLHSLYGVFSQTTGNFGYQIGSRFEQCNNEGTLKNTNKSYPKNYFSTFPSIHLSYRLSETQEIKTNYTRRINRPNSHMLNPFTDYSNPNTLRAGNPDLNPEYINAYEIGYSLSLKRISIMPSLYYRKINDVITRYSSALNDSVTMMSALNLTSASSLGVEFITVAQIMPNWTVNANFNFFRNDIKGNNMDAEMNNNSVSWSAKIISNMSIMKKVDWQFSINYQAPMATAQGTMISRKSVDMGFKMNVLQNKGTISLKVSDVFNTQEFGANLEGIRQESGALTYDQQMRRKRQAQYAMLTFSYRIGKEDKSTKRKVKQMNDSEPQMDNEMF